MAYSYFRRRMIKKFRPFFRKYGRRSRALSYNRRGYFKNNLSRTVNEFSRISHPSNIPTHVTSRIRASFTTTYPNVSEAAPAGARLIRGNFPIAPSVFEPAYRPNNIDRYTDYYQRQYTYAARIKVSFMVSQFNGGVLFPLQSLRFGVTPCMVQGGLGTPAMSAGNFEHWPDSNMTKSKFFNLNATEGNSNTIDLYVPITAFQDNQAAVEDWASGIGGGDFPERQWFFIVWAYNETPGVAFNANFTWQCDVEYFTRWSGPRDDNVIVAEP